MVTDYPARPTPTTTRPADAVSAVEKDDHQCANCLENFYSKSALHRHLRKTGHQVIDDHDEGRLAETSSEKEVRAKQRRDAVLAHFAGNKRQGCVAGPNTHDIDQGSLGGRPPPTDEADAAETPVCSLFTHPGQKTKHEEIRASDLRWSDIGSGVMSRTFPNADRMITTSKNGPNIRDIHSRRVWSLSSGKLIDDCIIDDTADSRLHRLLDKPDDIRVEVVLKNAIKLFERQGPDVCEIFSQPRVCQEAGSRNFGGTRLTPGWSLDLTTTDPSTGKAWDLSQPSVQSRVHKLVRDTKPYFIIGSPPCTPFSPLQEIEPYFIIGEPRGTQRR